MRHTFAVLFLAAVVFAPFVRAEKPSAGLDDASKPSIRLRSLPQLSQHFVPQREAELSSALWWLYKPNKGVRVSRFNYGDAAIYTLFLFPQGMTVPRSPGDEMIEKFDDLLEVMPGGGVYRTRQVVLVGYRFDTKMAILPPELQNKPQEEKIRRASDWAFVYVSGYSLPQNVLAREEWLWEAVVIVNKTLNVNGVPQPSRPGTPRKPPLMRSNSRPMMARSAW